MHGKRNRAPRLYRTTDLDFLAGVPEVGGVEPYLLLTFMGRFENRPRDTILTPLGMKSSRGMDHRIGVRALLR